MMGIFAHHYHWSPESIGNLTGSEISFWAKRLEKTAEDVEKLSNKTNI